MNVTERLNFSPYAPVRNQEQFWWIFAANAARDGLVLRDGRVDNGLAKKVEKELVQAGMDMLFPQIKKESTDPGECWHLAAEIFAKLAEMRHWVPLTGQFLHCGRQIFDLTDEVVEMLEHTDFGDCTLENLHLPYEAFFVRFGKREAIHIPFDGEDDFEYLDGAFVAKTPYDEKGAVRLKFGFSTCKKNGEGVMLPGYFLDFMPEEQAMPVMAAIEHAITRRASNFPEKTGSPEEDSINAIRRAEILRGGEILKQASSLIVNVLFYLDSLGGQQRSEPGRDAPNDYVVRWENSNPRQREKLKSRLLSEGYATVYLLGREFSNSNAVSNGSVRRAHWRRGHWRWQHHGQANSLIKRKWIKPQIIGAASADELKGHVYVVGNADTPDTRH